MLGKDIWGVKSRSVLPNDYKGNEICAGSRRERKVEASIKELLNLKNSKISFMLSVDTLPTQVRTKISIRNKNSNDVHIDANGQALRQFNASNFGNEESGDPLFCLLTRLTNIEEIYYEIFLVMLCLCSSIPFLGSIQSKL